MECGKKIRKGKQLGTAPRRREVRTMVRGVGTDSSSLQGLDKRTKTQTPQTGKVREVSA